MRLTSPIPHKKARIEIIPLIDIMFFLLASFMMVSLSQVHMKGIKVNLPAGVSGEVQTKREYVSVSVDKDGHYFFDKDEIPDTELLNRLKIAHLLDLVRAAGYYKISFEIKSESLKAVPGSKSF